MKLALLFSKFVEYDLTILENPERFLSVEELVKLEIFIKQELKNFTLLIISNNLPLLAHTCQNLTICFDQRVIESGSVSEIINYPYHPLTWEIILKYKNLMYDNFYSNYKKLRYKENMRLFSFIDNYILNIELLLLPLPHQINDQHVVYS